jgi:cytochrome c oxidase subunit IV
MSAQTHSSTQQHSVDEVRKHLKVYIGVFLALLVGTAITVGAWFLHFESVAFTIALALFIACIKAFLVAGYFMHLMSERKTIYAVLLTTVFFFAAMMYLTVWSRDQMPKGTVYHSGPNTPETRATH